MGRKRRVRVETLGKRIRDDDPITRRIAIEKAERLGSPDAIELLIVALDDPDDENRGQASRALGNLRATIAVTPLLQVLNGSGLFPREAALTALQKIGSPVPPAMLVPLVLDEDIGLQVCNSLDVLCPGWVRSSEAQRLVPRAIDAVGEAQDRRVSGAITFLGRIGASEAVPALRLCLRDLSSYREHATEALEMIADPVRGPKTVGRYLKQDEIDDWWGKLETSGWLAEVPPRESKRIRTGVGDFVGHPENVSVVLSPAWIDATSIRQSGDYRRSVVPQYRSASFRSFMPKEIKDRVDLEKGVAEVSFRVDDAVFFRQFSQKSEELADGFHEFMNDVMRDIDHPKRFYRLPWPSRETLLIVCVTPETYAKARAVGLIPTEMRSD